MKEGGNNSKFNKKNSFGGNNSGKSRNSSENSAKFKNNKSQKKPVGKRPGKITRLNIRNKKFSKK